MTASVFSNSQWGVEHRLTYTYTDITNVFLSMYTSLRHDNIVIDGKKISQWSLTRASTVTQVNTDLLQGFMGARDLKGFLLSETVETDASAQIKVQQQSISSGSIP